MSWEKNDRVRSAQPLEDLLAGSGGGLDHRAEARHAPTGRGEGLDDLVERLEQGGVDLEAAVEVFQPPRPGMVVAEVRPQ